jgi:hypothetical protein
MNIADVAEAEVVFDTLHQVVTNAVPEPMCEIRHGSHHVI